MVGGNVEVHVEFLEARRRPAGRSENLGDVLWIGARTFQERSEPTSAAAAGAARRQSLAPPSTDFQRACASTRAPHAVYMTAGHNALRGSGPDQKVAFEQCDGTSGLP